MENVQICGFDPYLPKKLDFNDGFAYLPVVEYRDIVNYLVLQTPLTTKQQMKAYKSFKAIFLYLVGWCVVF